MMEVAILCTVVCLIMYTVGFSRKICALLSFINVFPIDYRDTSLFVMKVNG